MAFLATDCAGVVMKSFELVYLVMEPFLLPLHREMRSRIRAAVRERRGNALLLDVGGRKSHYTIGTGARVIVSDLPRTSDLQHALHLGADAGVIAAVRRRRSNVLGYVLNDLTESCFRDNSVDVVVAVEVLEHVDDDEKFVAEVAKALRKGGCFLMSTPNGDELTRVTNPDHRRHYKKRELEALLEKHFDFVRVEYGIVGGKSRMLGLRSWSVRHPLQTLLSMGGNVVNGFLSRRADVASRAQGTHHLLATALRL